MVYSWDAASKQNISRTAMTRRSWCVDGCVKAKVHCVCVCCVSTGPGFSYNKSGDFEMSAPFFLHLTPQVSVTLWRPRCVCVCVCYCLIAFFSLPIPHSPLRIVWCCCEWKENNTFYRTLNCWQVLSQSESQLLSRGRSDSTEFSVFLHFNSLHFKSFVSQWNRPRHTRVQEWLINVSLSPKRHDVKICLYSFF